jgi:hypothetical protein
MASSRPDDGAEQAERVVASPCEEASKQGVEDAGEAAGPEEAPLPKLSAAEFRAYNKMATTMEYFVSGLFLFCFNGAYGMPPACVSISVSPALLFDR